MKNTVNLAIKSALASLILISPIVLTDASAKIKDVKFHFPTTSLDNIVHMVMEHNGNGWHWTNKSDIFNARVKVYFKASGKVGSASVRLIDTGAGIWALPAGYKTKKYEKLVNYSVSKAMLSPFQSKAKAVCDVFGGSKKRMHDIGLKAEMYVSQNTKVVRKHANMPVRIVCMPKSPTRKPVEMKVSKIKLYTIPAKPRCNKPVKLVTEILTNKAGKVNFSLQRNDGEFQKVSIVTVKGSAGYAKRWSKTYTFKENVDRRYRIVLAKQPMTSKWTNLKVSCGLITTGRKTNKLSN